MANKKYWQSFGELNNSEAYEKSISNEFKEDLPFESADKKGLDVSPASRRDFLKYLGFSTAAAIVAASCETKVRKAIPYVNKPQDMVPGVADYYATTYVSGGEAIPVVAKVRDGRPIKLEGNTLSTFTKGGSSARMQASVLDLYDTARLKGPYANNSATAIDVVDRDIKGALAGLGGGQLVLLTSTITSPSAKQVIAEFLAKYPNSKHVQYDAISYTGILLANEATFGKRAIPTYNFGNAQTIVSLGADFLCTWLSPVEFQHGYSKNRKVHEKNVEMSKHFQFESMMSTTGASADERFVHRPSEAGIVAAALLSAVNGQGATGVTGKLKEGIEKAAKELVANKGKGLVVSGSNNTQVQIIVNAINEAIGAYGSTISWGNPILMHQGIDSEMVSLVQDMEAGRVGALLIYGANPSYEYFDAERFNKGLKSVKLSVSFNDRKDETTELCKYVVPAPHFLESWGDAEPKAGIISLIQPTINPLFNTRPFEESLLKWSGNATAWDVYLKNYWIAKLGSVGTFDKALQDGVIETQAMVEAATFNAAPVAQAIAAANAMKKGGEFEVVVYQKVGVGSGKQANNPWLLELPDPITRVSWDNYAVISPVVAKKFGIDLNDRGSADKYEVNTEKPVIKVKVRGKEVELPIIVIPGTQENTIAIAVGYGRSKGVGRSVGAADGGTLGKNAYPFLSFNGSTIEWNGQAEMEKTDKLYKIAQGQTHNSYEGREGVIREVTFEEYKKEPNVILHERAKELEHYGGIEGFAKEGTIYPDYPGENKPGIKWGMSIDLNSCFGCGACVVACHIENNVPIVGKHEVARYHDMHWLRIDRYFSGNPNDAESIQTVFQPMLCQHCDNAPCENVCPVAATHHSQEGINMMAYNRCIGTRYCANNCPYKVRRFNWADYTGADSFPNNQQPLVDEGNLDDVILMMNDDLTRMVLNPDVTVRSRGVMEKCSFCVQRTQAGKLEAKKQNRPLSNDDVKTACQQACSADAIVFGNANDSQSLVSQVRKQYNSRLYHSLEETHTMPNVNYLAKVRNTAEISNEGVLGTIVGGSHAEEAPAEAAAAEHKG
ncbi:[Fe-S]-binding protein [Niastella yeongjuensis]|uniref:[Fe-S]-binding protein n=1 Tax=Niastella yeongjuensis TaxID=354355 RepID=A0A1V9EWP7_9BACT|nr:TAT-variant-translocated molybdopterin oxidoreductase [Niastella yeongjuensis]OQP50567.1 [Fe-S]-binding protein [Niastella yeongjuensis]SEN28438.1 prokaryotic molybdopterin-containing oxidoreductase family, iron-sulfur binding subunit [Niastella yeongjuensis]